MKILSALGVRTRIIKPFDPWRGKLCTCPSKFSFDPYTGCEHGCLYCYASSYVRRFHECRPKRDLLRVVRNDVARLPDDVLISMSNSSDPLSTDGAGYATYEALSRRVPGEELEDLGYNEERFDSQGSGSP
jgi:DNA repair photolyase